MNGVVVTGTGRTPEQVQRAFFRAAERQMKVAVAHAAGAIKTEAPAKTGHLRRSVTFVVHVIGDTIVGVVGTNVQYGLWVNSGTGLYGPEHRLIVPVRAKALRFPEPGNPGFRLSGQQRQGKAGAGARWVYARSVKGIKPRKFFEKGAATAAPVVRRDLREIPTVAVKFLGGTR